MKLDEIINQLYILQSCESEGSRMETLIDLVTELAQHVKAQEPEPMDEVALGLYESMEGEKEKLLADGYEATDYTEAEVPDDQDHPYQYWIDSAGTIWRKLKKDVKVAITDEEMEKAQQKYEGQVNRGTEE